MNEGIQLRMEGLELAESKHLIDLAKAQQVAQLIGMCGRAITAEDVREAFQTHEGRPLKIGNAIGALFDVTEKTKRWEFVGYVTAKRPEAHGRKIASWILKDRLT